MDDRIGHQNDILTYQSHILELQNALVDSHKKLASAEQNLQDADERINTLSANNITTQEQNNSIKKQNVQLGIEVDEMNRKIQLLLIEDEKKSHHIKEMEKEHTILTQNCSGVLKEIDDFKKRFFIMRDEMEEKSVELCKKNAILCRQEKDIHRQEKDIQFLQKLTKEEKARNKELARDVDVKATQIQQLLMDIDLLKKEYESFKKHFQVTVKDLKSSSTQKASPADFKAFRFMLRKRNQELATSIDHLAALAQTPRGYTAMSKEVATLIQIHDSCRADLAQLKNEEMQAKQIAWDSKQSKRNEEKLRRVVTKWWAKARKRAAKRKQLEKICNRLAKKEMHWVMKKLRTVCSHERIKTAKAISVAEKSGKRLLRNGFHKLRMSIYAENKRFLAMEKAKICEQLRIAGEVLQKEKTLKVMATLNKMIRGKRAVALKKFLRIWRKSVHQEHSIKGFQATLQKCFMASNKKQKLAKNSFCAWKAYTEFSNLRNTHFCRMIVSGSQRLNRRVLDNFKDHARQQVIYEIKAIHKDVVKSYEERTQFYLKKSLSTVMARMQGRSSRECFLEWQRLAEIRAEKQAVAQKLVTTVLHGAKANAYYRLKNYCKEMKKQEMNEQELMKGAERLKKRIFSRYCGDMQEKSWKTWIQYVEVVKLQRSQLLYILKKKERAAVKQYMEQWQEFCIEKLEIEERTKTLGKKILKRMLHTALYGAFSQWRTESKGFWLKNQLSQTVVNAEKQQQKTMAKIIYTLSRSKLEGSYKRWHTFAKQNQKRRRQFIKLCSNQENKLMRQGFHVFRRQTAAVKNQEAEKLIKTAKAQMAARSKELLAKAMGQSGLMLSRVSFERWRAHVEKTKDDRKIMTKFIAGVVHMKMKKGFVKWRSQIKQLQYLEIQTILSKQRDQSKKLIYNMLKQRSSSTMATCFKSWADHVIDKRHQKRAIFMILSKLSSKKQMVMMKDAYWAMKCNCLEQKLVEISNQRMMAVIVSREKLRIFKSWKSFAAKEAKTKKLQQYYLNKMLGKAWQSNTDHKSKAFSIWRRNAQKITYFQTIGVLAREQILQRALQKWSRAYKIKTAKRKIMTRMIHAQSRSFLREGFSIWHTWIVKTKKIRIMKQKIWFGNWKRSAQKSRRAGDQRERTLRLMVSKMLSVTMGHYLSHWRKLNAQDRQMAHKWLLSMRHSNISVKRKSIKMWKKYVASRIRARETLDYFLNLNNRLLKKEPMQKWRRILREEDALKDAVDKCLRMCLNRKLSYGLRQWKANARAVYILECERVKALERVTTRLKPNRSIVFKKWRNFSRDKTNQKQDRKVRGMLLVHRIVCFSERKHYAIGAKMSIFTLLRQGKALCNEQKEREKQDDIIAEILLKQRMFRVWISNSIQDRRKTEKLKWVVSSASGGVYRRTLKNWRAFIYEHQRDCSSEKEQVIALRLKNTELRLTEEIKQREGESLRNQALIKLIDTLKGKVVQLSTIIRNRERRFQDLAADNATLLGHRAETNSKRLEKLKFNM